VAERLLMPRVRTAPPGGGHARSTVAVPARLTWKDQSGATRFASVVTRDVTEDSAFVECETRASIPLYRLVHLQVEQTAGREALPSPLRNGRVLSAVWQVAPCSPATGTPGGYRLRFLVDPARIPVASVTTPDAHLIAVAAG
jgi:hypothetical protein